MRTAATPSHLDRFFARYAGQNQFRHHIGATYVALESETILGFATVSCGIGQWTYDLEEFHD